MWLSVLVLIVGLTLQIACGYVSHLILQRWAPNGYDSRSCYLVSLLCGVLIVGVPSAVAAVFGLLSLSTAGCIYAGGLALFGLGLVFDAGHLMEAGAVAFVCIWMGVFMAPNLPGARERAGQQQQQRAPQAVEPAR